MRIKYDLKKTDKKMLSHNTLVFQLMRVTDNLSTHENTAAH